LCDDTALRIRLEPEFTRKTREALLPEISRLPAPVELVIVSAPIAARADGGSRFIIRKNHCSSRYVSNAVVSLTTPGGVILTVRANSFGYCRFKDIPAGAAYVVSVSSKSYRFDPQIVRLMEDLNGLDLTAR
jgi:hypothetical protein